MQLRDALFANPSLPAGSLALVPGASGTRNLLHRVSQFILAPQRVLLRFSALFLDCSSAIPVVSGDPLHIDLSRCAPDFLPTNRCVNTRFAKKAPRNYSLFKKVPSPGLRARNSRLDWSQAAPAEVSLYGSGLRLPQNTSSLRRSNSAHIESGARNLTSPIESRKLRICCTKTSPQQTDPPTS